MAHGATRTFDPLQEDVDAELKQDGPRADVAIEFSGAYAALRQAIGCVRIAGHVVAAGFYQGGATGLNLG